MVRNLDIVSMPRISTWLKADAASSEKWTFVLVCMALFSLPMGTSPFTICGIAAVVVGVLSLQIFKGYKRYIYEPWFWPVTVWICLIWGGLLYTQDETGLGIKFALKSHYWIYAFLVATLSGLALKAKWIINAFLAGLSINSFVAVMQMFEILPVKKMGKFFGFASGYNTLSIWLIIGILTASYYFKEARSSKRRLVYLIVLLLFFCNLIILRGRSGYVTFALLSPFVIYNLCRGKRLLIGFLLYLLVIDIMSYSPFVQERVIDTINDIKYRLQSSRDIAFGKKYSDLEERAYMWYWSVKIFTSNPVLGVGTGGFHHAVIEAGGDVGVEHPHNNFLHMSVQYGLLGIFIFIWFFYVLLIRAWRNRGSPLGFFILSGSLTFFISGFTNSHILDAGPLFFLSIITGLQTGLPIKSNSEEV
jgi:O-antigen ligase